MVKGIAIAIALAATSLPDLKTEQFTVIEKSDTGAVAISAPHQDSKDVRSIWLLIFYAEVSDKGTQAILGHIEFNCTLSQYRADPAYRLAPDTTVLGTLNPSTSGWQPVRPNSQGGALFQIVCGHDAQPTQEART